MMQDPKIELWALDEVIFQLHGTTCKMWVAPEDLNPVVYHNPVKKNVKYYGAVTRRTCTHNRYFPATDDIVAVVEPQFDQWRHRSEALKRLCAIT